MNTLFRILALVFGYTVLSRRAPEDEVFGEDEVSDWLTVKQVCDKYDLNPASANRWVLKDEVRSRPVPRPNGGPPMSMIADDARLAKRVEAALFHKAHGTHRRK